MKIFTTISISQVEALESVFAYMTDCGWIIPNWLVALKEIVEKSPQFYVKWSLPNGKLARIAVFAKSPGDALDRARHSYSGSNHQLMLRGIDAPLED